MDFVTYNTLAEAVAADAGALSFLIARDGAKGNAWSNLFTDDGETEFGLTFADDIDAFFSTTSPKSKKVKKPNFHKKEPAEPAAPEIAKAAE